MHSLSLAVALLPLSHQNAVLSAGPMLGYVEMTEVGIWIQTQQPSSVQIRAVSPDGTLIKSDVVRADATNDHIANLKLTNLKFGTEYRYELLVNGRVVPRDYPTTFRTQPHWRWTSGDTPPGFTFAFGSCSYFNDAPFDRPGTPYGGPTKIFRAIDEKRPDFMLWLGDNDYYREPDWLTESAMRYRMRTGRSNADLQPLLARTANYAIWDDHDYGPNDSDRSFRLKDKSLRVFSDYWPNLQYGTSETKGVFHRFEWVDCEFFMLDDRYHRSPNNAPADAEKVMFGKAQVQWLKDSLLNSQATFKFIVNGNQMINENRFECFSQFPAERDDLFRFIAKNKINGVLILSGDRHIGELLTNRAWDMTYPLWEFTSSPLTSGVGSQATSDKFGVEGTLVKERNFGLIEVGGKKGARTVRLQARGAEGKLIWEKMLSESDLTAR